MLRDTLFSKGWLSRLMSSRKDAEAGTPTPGTEDLVACDEHGEVASPLESGSIRVHALEPTGYGVFEDRGYWLVTFGGRWYQASSLTGAYTPISSGSVPVALVAAVAHVSLMPARRTWASAGRNVPVQTGMSSSDT